MIWIAMTPAARVRSGLCRPVRANLGRDPDRVLSKKGLEILFTSQLAMGYAKLFSLSLWGCGERVPFAFETLQQ